MVMPQISSKKAENCHWPWWSWIYLQSPSFKIYEKPKEGCLWFLGRGSFIVESL